MKLNPKQKKALSAVALAIVGALFAKFSPNKHPADACKVIKVADGDTLTCIDNNGQTVKVRMNHIDAPEKKQAFGMDAQACLSSRVLNQTVRLERESQDRYGRILGVVHLGDTNINLELVREGCAWEYKEYNKDPLYKEAEKQAKAQKLGLWKGKNPQYPHEYRAQLRRQRTHASHSDEEE